MSSSASITRGRCSRPEPNDTISVRRSGPRFGVFDEMKDACAAAQDAFEQLKQKGVAGRAKVFAAGRVVDPRMAAAAVGALAAIVATGLYALLRIALQGA